MRQAFEESAALRVQASAMRDGIYKRSKFFSLTGQFLAARSASELPVLRIGGTVELDVPGKPDGRWRVKGLVETVYGSHVIIEPARDNPGPG